MPRPKIRTNGEPGQYELEWSLVEKWLVGIFAPLIVLGVAASIGTYRQVGEVQARVTSSEKRLDDHISDSQRIHARLEQECLQCHQHHSKGK